MINFTYRDLKVITNDMTYIQFQHGMRDNFSTFKFNPIYNDLNYFLWFKS